MKLIRQYPDKPWLSANPNITFLNKIDILLRSFYKLKPSLKMSTLYDYQKAHVNRLSDILMDKGKALDYSITGSGKTITSLHTYKSIKNEKTKMQLVVVCPPLLKDGWKKHIEKELPGDDILIISSYGLKKFINKIMKKLESWMLIIDECHYFKNIEANRTKQLRRILKLADYSLLLSATPIDDDKQKNNLSVLLGASGAKGERIQDKISSMSFTYKTTLSMDLQHFNLGEEHSVEYKSGYSYIFNAAQGVQHENHFESFVPEFFTIGVRKMHNALFPYLCKFLKEELKKTSFKKFVIVLRYGEHFQDFKAIFKNALILNGKVPNYTRIENINLFQNNDEYNIIAVSADVGGVGIELDDKIGSNPRHIIMLPTTNGVNFKQIIGRVQRTNTKSNSKITVIQPLRNRTYFKSQMDRRSGAMKKYNALPKYNICIHDHTEECGVNGSKELEKYFPKDLINIINNYSCNCINKL